MLSMTCPKCHSKYERHPLTPAAQELCPACRNAASWDEIKNALAAAASAAPAEVAESAQAAHAPQVSPVAGDDDFSAPRAFSSSFGAARLSSSFVSAKLAASRGQSNPFAPRVSDAELAVTARGEAALTAVDNAAAPERQTMLAPQTSATVAVASPIQLAPNQPEIPLMAAGMDLTPPAMLNFNIGSLPSASPAPKMDFPLQITPTAPVIGIQAPDVCGG
ncbi:hypothetical protein LJC48_05280 [Desulfovibrio sp. OttesenSCG-928-C06]|nr:hypothetical protein [Desulfovibrio sp. OttesenSCG-928-C06]